MKLELKEVSKSYGKNKALDTLTVTLTKGLYGLIGSNGAGKTTLINILVGLLSADSGEIKFWKDKNKTDEYYNGIPLDEIGYLPQNPGFYKNFTAKEFIHYIMALKNCKKVKDYCDELLSKVNLYEVRNNKIGSFSGGMKQRLGIAQTIINDPKVAIFDEPTAGLDPRERIRFRNIISSMSKDKIVILATHIVTDIEFVAKEVLLLKKGLLIKNGTQEQLIKQVKDKVWEVHVDGESVMSLMNDFKVSNVENNGNGYIVRIVNDEKPCLDAESVTPTLEDVCLYLFGED